LPDLSQVAGTLWGIAVGDINKDGRPDLAVSHVVQGPQAYLQQADGSWNSTGPVMPNLEGGSWSVALGDLDGDGHLDMVVGGNASKERGSSYGLFLLRGDGAGGWTEVADTGLPATGLGFPWGIALDDINGDGRLDIAATNSPPDKGLFSGLGRKKGEQGAQTEAGSAETGQADGPKSPDQKTVALPGVQVWLNQDNSPIERSEAAAKDGEPASE
jgi:hypothetical protein